MAKEVRKRRGGLITRDRALLYNELMQPTLIERAHNVVLLGPSGAGKTHQYGLKPEVGQLLTFDRMSIHCQYVTFRRNTFLWPETLLFNFALIQK